MAVDADGDAAGADAADGEPQNSTAGQGIWQIEVDSPRRGAANAASIAAVIGSMGNLLKIPVLAVVADADGVIYVTVKEISILEVHSPVEIVVALEELRAFSVGDADVPDLPAIANGLPGERAE